MANTFDKPLLLLDNSSMMTALNDGEYKYENLTFDAARAIIDMHEEKIFYSVLQMQLLKR